SSEDIAALEDAIRKDESTFDAPSASMARSFARSNSWTALLFGGGLIAGAGAAYLLLSGLPKTGSNADTALPHQQLLRAYNEQLPLMPEAVSYLRELSAEIVRRQKEDPTSLRVEKTLMLLSIFDGDLA